MKRMKKEVIDALQKRDIEDLKKIVEEGFKGVHLRQDHTNGNVTSLRIWRGYMTGAIAVLTALILPIVFIFISNYLR